MVAETILSIAALPASQPMPINRPDDDAREISVSLIDAPAWNPRRDFNADELQELAATLSKDGVGLLQPIVVRPRGKRFQVVAGERRYRGAQHAGLKTVRCTVRALDDRQAAEVQLVENVQRADLNPLEIAVGFKALCDMGHTAASLAELVGAEESVVNDRLALLSLPDEWTAKLRSGELSPEAGCYLLAWIDRPEVLHAMLPAAKKWPMPLVSWKRELMDVVLALSCSMEEQDSFGPQFEATDGLLKSLDVFTIEPRPGAKVRRAWNRELWAKLQQAAVDQASADEASEPSGAPAIAAGSNGNGHAATSTLARSARMNSIAGRRAARGDSREGFTAEKFRKALVDYHREWLRSVLHNRIAKMSQEALEETCEQLRIEAAADWQLTYSFCALFVDGRLEELAADLGVSLDGCDSDAEKIRKLLKTGPSRMPSALLKAIGKESPANGKPAA